jgi:hypothetical protein
MQELQGINGDSNLSMTTRLSDPKQQEAKMYAVHNGERRVKCVPASNLSASARRHSVFTSLFTLALHTLALCTTVRWCNHASPTGRILPSHIHAEIIPCSM